MPTRQRIRALVGKAYPDGFRAPEGEPITLVKLRIAGILMLGPVAGTSYRLRAFRLQARLGAVELAIITKIGAPKLSRCRSIYSKGDGTDRNNADNGCRNPIKHFSPLSLQFRVENVS
jgi:hypothetical protein